MTPSRFTGMIDVVTGSCVLPHTRLSVCLSFVCEQGGSSRLLLFGRRLHLLLFHHQQYVHFHFVHQSTDTHPCTFFGVLAPLDDCKRTNPGWCIIDQMMPEWYIHHRLEQFLMFHQHFFPIYSNLIHNWWYIFWTPWMHWWNLDHAYILLLSRLLPQKVDNNDGTINTGRVQQRQRVTFDADQHAGHITFPPALLPFDYVAVLGKWLSVDGARSEADGNRRGKAFRLPGRATGTDRRAAKSVWLFYLWIIKTMDVGIRKIISTIK